MNNQGLWMDKFAVASSQFFTLREDWMGLDYFFYQYKDFNYYVVVEPGELTFKIYDDSQIIIRNEEVFKIPLSNNTEANAYYESSLMQLSADENYNFFPKLFKNFLIDIYFNDGFKECGRIQLVKLALESIPLIQGIIDKTLFEHSIHLIESSYRPQLKDGLFALLEKRLKIIQKGKNNLQRSFSKLLEKKLNYYYDNWLNFMFNSSHERYFNKENNWFKDNLDSELVSLKKQYYSSNRILGGNKEVKRTANRFSSLMIRRYGTFEAIKLSKEKIVGNILMWGSLLVLMASAILILSDVIIYNCYDVDTSKWFLDGRNRFPQLICINIIWGIFLASVFMCSHLQLFPAVFLPRLIIAIISGWLLFISAEELLKIDYDIDGSGVFIASIIGLVVLAIFMTNEMRGYAPSMSGLQILLRSSQVLLIAFVISFFIGFFVMSYVNKKFMSIDNFLVDETAFMKDQEKNKILRKGLIPNFKNVLELTNETEKLNELNIDDKTKKDRLKKINKRSEKVLDNLMAHRPKSKYLDTLLVDYNEVNGMIKDIGKLNKSKRENNIFVNYFIKSYLDKIKIQLDKKRKEINKEFLEWENEMKGNEVSDLYQDNNDEMLDKLSSGEGIKIKNSDPIKAKEYEFNILGFNLGSVIALPNMILLRSILAMFIGVFLQLIIQDKSITEPI